MISIILVNYNNSIDTLNCLKSLQQQTLKEYEIIVVENKSNTKNRKMLDEILNTHEFNKPFLNKIRIFYTMKNMGFAGGANLGICKSNGDLILLLNSDTLHDPTFLEAMIDFFKKHKFVHIAQPKICLLRNKNIPPTKDLIWGLGGRINPFSFKLFKMIGYLKEEDVLLKKPFKIDYAIGCALFIQRDVLNKIGLLDNTFFIYVEDVDLCYRARKKGFNIYCNPTVKIYHDTSRKSSPNIRKYYFRNRNYFCYKNFPWYIIIWQLFMQFISLITMTLNIYEKGIEHDFFFKSIKGIVNGAKIGLIRKLQNKNNEEFDRYNSHSFLKNKKIQYY